VVRDVAAELLALFRRHALPVARPHAALALTRPHAALRVAAVPRRRTVAGPWTGAAALHASRPLRRLLGVRRQRAAQQCKEHAEHRKPPQLSIRFRHASNSMRMHRAAPPRLASPL
jgi:hypothetical protein